MLILKPLTVRPIALLFSGQLSAASAAELYRVALIWIAVGVAGAAGGYIVAAHSAMILLVTLVGGIWADQWNPRHTLIGVNLLRAAIVVLLPLAALSGGGIPGWLFWAVALIMAALTAFIDPALQTCLPRMAPTLAMLPAINGLIDGARRLARILGPGMVGVLAAFIPTEQFFSIVALLLLVAAALTYAVGPVLIDRAPTLQTDWKRRVIDGTVAGWRATRPHALLRFALPSLLITTTAWCIAFMLGLALLVREMPGADAQLYGIAVAAYGMGNFTSNVVVGSMNLRRSGLIMYLGRIVLGIGFVGMAAAPSPLWLMAAAAFAATGGPMNELPVLVRIQTDIPRPLVPAVFRLRLFMDHAGILLGLLIAPGLMSLVGTVPVVAAAGVATILVGLVGLWLFGGEKAPELGA
jgi:DHA3 family macrolide efflux protein-like MFS transporter